MAVGDIVGARSAIPFTFQPAATVQVMLTAVSTSDPNWIAIEDSTSINNMLYFGNGAWGTTSNVKIGITNALWIHFYTNGAYTGIQVK